MTVTAAHEESGFTLVEMIVALVIFALLASAGVGLLRSSIDVQSAVEGHLSDLNDVARIDALLSSDLGEAAVRPTRGPDGERPAFVGDGQHMSLVAAGWANLDAAPRSDLRRVEWQVAGGNLTRTAFANVDGADGTPIASKLAQGVTSATFRYRLLDGSWTGSFSSSERQPLPRAVELVVARSAVPPVRMVFSLPQSSDTGAPLQLGAAPAPGAAA